MIPIKIDSYNITFYNNSRLITRAYDAAVQSHSLIDILVLLKALTAYK
ncbi:MAG: hypothetical protein ACTSQP_19130 [Promethearchaeota archaeon]